MMEKVSLLILASLMSCPTDQVSLTVQPNTSQFFAGQSMSVSCKVDEGSAGWRMMREIAEQQVSQCGIDWGRTSHSSCTISLTVPWDTGVYWCESREGETSNLVNLTVTGGSVILQSPVLPVMEGDDLTLTCQSKSPSILPAAFYKDGSLIRNESTGHMTLQHVSRSDEGLYRCSISGHGESPPSWISVTGPPLGLAPPPEPSSLQLVFTLLRHLLVICPYFISTLLMVSLYRHKHTGNSPPTKAKPELDYEYDDVITGAAAGNNLSTNDKPRSDDEYDDVITGNEPSSKAKPRSDDNYDDVITDVASGSNVEDRVEDNYDDAITSVITVHRF